MKISELGGFYRPTNTMSEEERANVMLCQNNNYGALLFLACRKSVKEICQGWTMPVITKLVESGIET